MSHQEVIYQVELDIDPGIATDFDAWLAAHVEEMLAVSGFVHAEILADDDGAANGEWLRRTVQYRVASREALEHYFAHDAERMRAKGLARFENRFTATRRILSSNRNLSARPQVEEIKSCGNCSEPLTGQYCHHCGQRDRSRMISLWELVRDLLGDLFEVDSRLWRSLVPLLVRPGKLTREYLAGRRVHYTPPLRMYLVLSILFFVIASLGGDSTPRIMVDGQDVVQPAAGSDAGQREISDRCAEIDIESGIEFLDRPEVLTFIQDTCRRVTVDEGRPFARSLYNNLPKMMFIFLPLMALALKVLYIGSRRYYVEHLLFFVHFHSFFFLALTLFILLARLPDIFPGQGVITVLTIVAGSFYIPIYLFKALRQVYGQGFFFTLFKYCLLFITYIVCLAITMLFGLLITALSI